MKAFQEVLNKRKENIEKRKEEKLVEASKILVKNSIKEVKPKKRLYNNKKVKVKLKKK